MSDGMSTAAGASLFPDLGVVHGHLARGVGVEAAAKVSISTSRARCVERDVRGAMLEEVSGTVVGGGLVPGPRVDPDSDGGRLTVAALGCDTKPVRKRGYLGGHSARTSRSGR